MLMKQFLEFTLLIMIFPGNCLLS